MSKQDERLEEKLNALEEGEQQGDVMAGSSNSSELKSLVNLVASIRNLRHPEQDQQTVQTEKRKIISAAREKNPANKPTRSTKTKGFTGLWLFAPAVAGVALIVLMVFVLAAGAGLYFSGPRGAQAATLIEASGVLEVSNSGLAGDWYQVANGDRVRSGQRLRTGNESWVTLEFFDGSQMTLAPNTDVVLNNVDGDWGDELRVELIQNQGETNHQVIPLQGDEATYQVFTPSGEASVRGTSFSVLVEDSGISLFTVEDGEVLVSNDGYETNLAAGQSVVTELGVAMDAPSYQFSLQGQLGPKSGNTRSVAGVQFTVLGWTLFVGNPQDGDFVEVEGQINKKGEWIADRVTKLDDPVPSAGTLTGVVTSAGLDGLSIDGHPFTVVDAILEVAVGDLVRVTFTIDGEVWTVTTLEILESAQAPDQIDDTDGVTEPDIDGQQGLVFVPEEFEESACDSVPSKEFTLWYRSDSQDPITVNDLGFEILKGGEHLDSANGVQFNPSGPYVIDPQAQEPEVPFITITVNFLLSGGATSLPPDSEIKIRVYPIVDPAIQDVEMGEFKIELKCEGQKDEEAPTEKEGHYCTNREDKHPKALKLVEEYSDSGKLDLGDDPYGLIMDWFCINRYGFGEIDLMLGLSYEYPVDYWDVFDLRETGLGWGQIKRHLADEPQVEALTTEETKKVPPGKQKSDDAKNKNKPNKKKPKDD
jgi:hypothetical protein